MVTRGLATLNLAATLSKLDFFCRKCDIKTLKKVSFLLGSREGTTKSALRDELLAQGGLLAKLRNTGGVAGSLNLVAVDIGVENFAFCRLALRADEARSQLVEWSKMQLSNGDDTSKFSPSVSAQLAKNLTQRLSRLGPSVFVLERQRTRTAGSANVFEHVLRANVLEHVLFTLLQNQRFLGDDSLQHQVYSSDPRRMTEFWCKFIGVTSPGNLEGSNDQAKSSKTATKSLKIKIAKAIIAAALSSDLASLPTFVPTVAPAVKSQLVSYFNKGKRLNLFDALQLTTDAGRRKEDDLADALLHGLSWLTWVTNFDRLGQLLAKTTCDETGLQQFKSRVQLLTVEHVKATNAILLHIT
ncbi:LAMI_0A04808g1_1 [Lachancea mirantina]|uniref:LAMI_0A04808g1_1 n=1 Tax=Lachancea mirantina TaxID=1230905 RepID=A0A1G4IP51_9SACH|nr:LAMI_0A04808g1_1 [Lachancea mirantina]